MKASLWLGVRSRLQGVSGFRDTRGPAVIEIQTRGVVAFTRMLRVEVMERGYSLDQTEGRIMQFPVSWIEAV